MSDLIKDIRQSLVAEDGRYAYADFVVNAFVSAQIKSLREARDLSQEQLANLIGTKQSGISRLERADYSAWKVETLRKLARGFGVRLRISFEEFGTLADDVSGFSRERLTPRKFEEDPAFTSESSRGSGAFGKTICNCLSPLGTEDLRQKTIRVASVPKRPIRSGGFSQCIKSGAIAQKEA